MADPATKTDGQTSADEPREQPDSRPDRPPASVEDAQSWFRNQKDAQQSQDRPQAMRVFLENASDLTLHARVEIVDGPGGHEASTGPPTASVPPEDVRMSLCAFVEASWYEQASSRLEETRVLILQGAAGRGKYTAALRLLNGCGLERLLVVHLGATLRQLENLQPVKNHGYVLATLNPETASRLDHFLLLDLNAKLESAGGWMVVTVSNAARLGTEELSKYLIRCETDLQPAMVLEQHLRDHLGNRVALLDPKALVNDEQVRAVLERQPSPAVAARLGRELASVACRPNTKDQVLARFGDAAGQAREWFATHDDLRACTFMLSVALLNGTSYQVVADAAETLQAKLERPRVRKEPPSAASIFCSPRRTRVEEAEATLEPGYEDTLLGPSPVDVVRLKNPALRDGVLKYVWEESDPLRKPLLVWLRSLGSHSNLEARLRAAWAVGTLSTYDFQYVCHEVLTPWASTGTATARESAALALAVPASQNELAPQVLELLTHWGTSGDNWRLAWTAAASYGGPVGLIFPVVALEGLWLISEAGNWELAPIVGQSLSILADQGYRKEVLDSLLRWTAPGESRTARINGLLAFLWLMLDVDPGGEAGRPNLIELAGPDAAVLDSLASLWQRSLGEADTRPMAEASLRHWVDCADEAERCYRIVEAAFLALAARSDRDRDRLRSRLHEWGNDRNNPSPAAARLAARLSRGDQ